MSSKIANWRQLLSPRDGGPATRLLGMTWPGQVLASKDGTTPKELTTLDRLTMIYANPKMRRPDAVVPNVVAWLGSNP